MDPKKIEAIRGWSTPKNVTKVISFIGLAGYYKIFIEGFSKIAHPVTSLQKKGVKFQWTLHCEKSFQHLCKEGLGGVLSQNGYVVCYESRKLKEHERHYATHDLDLASTVHALKMWRHYVMGKRFKLRTYHNGLKYLFGQPTLNAKKSRWL
jgi:hypothetical protein